MRLGHAVPCPRPDALRHGPLIRILGQHDKRQRNPDVKKFCQQANRLRVAGIVLEQNQAERLLLQYGPGFLQRVGVFELSRESAMGLPQHLANQEKVLLLFADQQDAQSRRRIVRFELRLPIYSLHQ